MATMLSIADLRARIQELEGVPRISCQRLASGVSELDRLVEGLPRPGIFELAAPRGAGAVRLALRLAAVETSSRRRVAWVDQERTLFPPAALSLGVDLDRLLIVQPPAGGANRGQHPGSWAIEQLLRSGCFRLVIVTECGRTPQRFMGTRWRQAAERGACTGVFISRTRKLSRVLSADVRVSVEPGRLTVSRDKRRPVGATGLLPPSPPHIDPFVLPPCP